MIKAIDSYYDKLNKEEEFWFIRWIFMRMKYLNALLKIEELESGKLYEISKLRKENERLNAMLTNVRLEFAPINNTVRKYKKPKKKN